VPRPHIVMIVVDDMGYHNIQAPPHFVNSELYTNFLLALEPSVDVGDAEWSSRYTLFVAALHRDQGAQQRSLMSGAPSCRSGSMPPLASSTASALGCSAPATMGHFGGDLSPICALPAAATAHCEEHAQTNVTSTPSDQNTTSAAVLATLPLQATRSSNAEVCNVRGRTSRVRSAFLLKQERDFRVAEKRARVHEEGLAMKKRPRVAADALQPLGIASVVREDRRAEAGLSDALVQPVSHSHTRHERAAICPARGAQVLPAMRKRGSKQEQWQIRVVRQEDEEADSPGRCGPCLTTISAR